MSKSCTHRYVFRGVIEFLTPFLIGAGRGGDVADAVFVADANGLPTIPGSSLAGVLRAAYSQKHGAAAADDLFGFQRGDQGNGSRLAVSWACIHDANNTPVEGIVPRSRLDDPVLAKAMSPGIRDHVRINHRGASDAGGLGKFDEQAVCAGHRFTFEMELTGTEENEDHWRRLLSMLNEPGIRLGGKSRRGFGAFTFVSLASRAFALRQDFDAYCQHPVALSQASPVLPLIDLDEACGEGRNCSIPTIALHLEPRGYWMFGGGYDRAQDAGDADMAPVRDCRIEWDKDNNVGKVSEDLLVIPATGIKGAIAHRVAFHYNALTGRFADSIVPTDVDFATGEGNPAVRELFGFCKGRKNSDSGDQEDGQRGRVILDDQFVEVEPQSQLVHHVGIDRFTGGARDQVLFCERPNWKGPRIDCQLHIADTDSIADANVFKALRLALADLAEGRLQIGAGAGRGLGYFTGTVEWPRELDV